MAYIEKDEALAIIENKQREICPMGLYSRNAISGSDREAFDNWQEILDEIEAIPSADVAPVRHGRWEYYDTYIDGITIFRCTCCGDLQSGRHGWGWKKNYCPNCGATMEKMDLEG